MAEPTRAEREQLLHDVAKGGMPAAVIGLLGWLLMGQLSDLTAQVANLRAEVVTLQVQAAERTADRWTGAQHLQYAREVDAQFRSLEDRVTRLETVKP